MTSKLASNSPARECWYDEAPLSIRDLDHVLNAHQLALKAHAEQLEAARKRIAAAVEAYAQIQVARAANPRVAELEALWTEYKGRKDAIKAEQGITWQALIEEHSQYSHPFAEAKREVQTATDELEEHWNNTASETGNYSFVAGRIPGYRMGFLLADRMKGGTFDFGGYKAEELPVIVAVSMLDDYKAERLLMDLFELFNFSEAGGGDE